VGKYGRARHFPDNNIVRCRKTRFVCLITTVRMKTCTRTICYWLLIVNHCEMCLCSTKMQREFIATFPWHSLLAARLTPTAVKRERIVALPWQQWLHERTKM
jgi:hypothetical protein